MDSSSSRVFICPAINSSPDVSGSSGTSRNSTRTTSPASCSHRSSPLLDLRQFPATNIEHHSNTLIDLQDKMDQNAFQSVNMRRDKMTAERCGESITINNTSQIQRPVLQPQTLRPITSGGAHAPRSLASNNWRTQPFTENVYSALDSASAAAAATSDTVRAPISFAANNQSRMEQHQAALMLTHNMAPFSDIQLDSSYAYCFDRGNGQYTRLIPADMLPLLQTVPALQQGCHGMIVLPPPRGFPANGRLSNNESAVSRTPPATPITPADNIQSRIDTIIASTPTTPTHRGHHSSTGSSSANNYHQNSAAFPAGSGAPQHHQPQRRPKIYCDKWVHEGVCAFTQQGCKYKHEMPFDKVTQNQLGLFHGLPAWWKKHQADLVRQRDVPQSMTAAGLSEAGNPGEHSGPGMGDAARDKTSNGFGGRSDFCGIDGTTSPTSQTWRQQNDRELAKTGGVDQAQHNRGFVMANGIGSQESGTRGGLSASVWNSSPFGPIAPPQRTVMQDPRFLASSTQSGMASMGKVPTNNPYASLEALDEGRPESSDSSRLG